MGGHWRAIGFVALLVVVAVLRLGPTFAKDPIATTVVLSAFVLPLVAAWPVYVRRRDRWIATVIARVPGAHAVRASALSLDRDSNANRPLPGMLVLRPDALEFWGTWSLWRRDPHLVLRLPWTEILGVRLGEPASRVSTARRIVIERRDGLDVSFAILAPGFFGVPLDAAPTLSALSALRERAIA